MAKVRKSFGEFISQIQLMSIALKNNQEDVAKRGIHSDFISELDQITAEVLTLSSEQDKLKAELKQKTEMISKKVDVLQAKMSEARKVVKLAIPKILWKEFGIEDKR